MNPTLVTIYERLRKQSYRKTLKNDRLWDAYFAGAVREQPDYWDEEEHHAYLKGVRDALAAVS